MNRMFFVVDNRQLAIQDQNFDTEAAVASYNRFTAGFIGRYLIQQHTHSSWIDQLTGVVVPSSPDKARVLQCPSSINISNIGNVLEAKYTSGSNTWSFLLADALRQIMMVLNHITPKAAAAASSSSSSSSKPILLLPLPPPPNNKCTIVIFSNNKALLDQSNVLDADSQFVFEYQELVSQMQGRYSISLRILCTALTHNSSSSSSSGIGSFISGSNGSGGGGSSLDESREVISTRAVLRDMVQSLYRHSAPSTTASSSSSSSPSTPSLLMLPCSPLHFDEQLRSLITASAPQIRSNLAFPMGRGSKSSINLDLDLFPTTVESADTMFRSVFGLQSPEMFALADESELAAACVVGQSIIAHPAAAYSGSEKMGGNNRRTMSENR